MQEIVRQTPALRPAIESIIAGQVATSLRQVDDVTPQQVPRQPGAGCPITRSWKSVRRKRTESRVISWLPANRH